MSRRTVIFVLGAILVAWSAAVFMPARHFDFVNWDDYNEIVENPNLHPPTAEHLGGIWSGPYLRLYAPLSYSGVVGIDADPGGGGQSGGVPSSEYRVASGVRRAGLFDSAGLREIAGGGVRGRGDLCPASDAGGKRRRGWRR